MDDCIATAELIRRGDLSAAEAVGAAIERISAAGPLNAVISERFEAAVAEAGAMTGPLAGVPFLLKELGAPMAGLPDRMGCRALADRVAEQSSWTVERYRAAGLVVLGTTNTPEWGNHCTTEPLLTGPTINPRAPDRSPGGSSGGSAVAVTAGLVPAASGGDGTGSIRVPAACCGVVGLKPRRARKTLGPGAGHGLEGLVSEHALTRTVRDCALLLDLTAGEAPGDPYTAPPPARPFLDEVAEGASGGPVRVVMPDTPPLGGVMDAEVRAAVERVGVLLGELGHAVDTGAGPVVDAAAVTDAVAVLHGVSNVELFRLAESALGRAPTEDDLEPSSWQMAQEGFAITGEQYADAIAAIHAAGRSMGEDVLLVPTLLTTVPPLGLLNQPRGSVAEFFAVEFATTGWTALANVAGWAAISLPLADDAQGRPIGIQLMAPSEAVLLRLGAQLERAVS